MSIIFTGRLKKLKKLVGHIEPDGEWRAMMAVANIDPMKAFFSTTGRLVANCISKGKSRQRMCLSVNFLAEPNGKDF